MERREHRADDDREQSQAERRGEREIKWREVGMRSAFKAPEQEAPTAEEVTAC